VIWRLLLWPFRGWPFRARKPKFVLADAYPFVAAAREVLEHCHGPEVRTMYSEETYYADGTPASSCLWKDDVWRADTRLAADAYELMQTLKETPQLAPLTP
jgi:hypothetical protein